MVAKLKNMKSPERESPRGFNSNPLKSYNYASLPLTDPPEFHSSLSVVTYISGHESLLMIITFRYLTHCILGYFPTHTPCQ